MVVRQCYLYDGVSYTGKIALYWTMLQIGLLEPYIVNTLRPRQNGRHFPDDIFKRIFLNQNVRIPINISLKFVPKGPINNIPALVQIMAWRRPGDKPLSETVLVSLLTHICVTRPQWVNCIVNGLAQPVILDFVLPNFMVTNGDLLMFKKVTFFPVIKHTS